MASKAFFKSMNTVRVDNSLSSGYECFSVTLTKAVTIDFLPETIQVVN